MTETIQLTPSQVPRLVAGLRVAVEFIRTHIPADVIATKRGWGRANAALKLEPDTQKDLTEIYGALVWAYCFIAENYRGSAIELADTIRLLTEIGSIEVVERKPIHPDHPTNQ